MTRPVRIAVVIVALAAVQGAIYLAYRAIERSRAAHAGRFVSERLRGTEPAPPFDGRRADGRRVTVAGPSPRLRLVHFWGTWCPPCRAELPGLLALARELEPHGVEVLAVAIDDDWNDLTRFFGGDIPPEVVIASDRIVHKRYGAVTLPDSYLVDRAGALIERIHGQRDWSAPAARAHLLRAATAAP